MVLWLPALPLASGFDAEIEVLPSHQLGEVYPFWTVRNFVHQDMFADPEAVAGVIEDNPFIREVNCVRLIGGRSDGKNEFFKGLDENGNLICDFTLLLKYVNGILDAGFTPRIVLDNVPNAMRSELEFHHYGNTFPPDDYHVYHRYIKELVQALVDEFGYREVSRWRFRVGTEPDLKPGHWAGTKQEYLKMYDFAVNAVTQVIPDADIGPGNILNPLSRQGSDEPLWGLEIIDHAAAGTNYCTGQIGTRLTFFSCSWYDRIGGLNGVGGLSQTVRVIRRRLDNYPQFKGIPIEIAEFMILHDAQNHRLWAGDITEWSASWFAAVAEQVYALNIPKVHLWSTTTRGIFHPQTHLIEFLDKAVGGQRLESIVRGRFHNRIGAIAASTKESLYVMIYHHVSERSLDHPLDLRIQISIPPGSNWLADQWQTDADHGVFIHQFKQDCMDAGLEPLEGGAEFDGAIQRWYGPEGVALFEKNRAAYQKLSDNIRMSSSTPVETDAGYLIVDLTLPVHSVRMIRFHPVP